MTAPMFLLAIALHGGADTSFRLPRNGAVEIDSRLRDITVRVGAGDMVTIRGADAELDGGTLQVSADERRGRNAPGAIEVTVPAWCQVDVSTMSGNLTFTDTPERLHAETVGGWIHVNGGSGVVELETVGGAVVVNDFKGTRLAIDANSENVTVTNATGMIEIDDVSGNVMLRGIRATSVSASTINGSVEFEGVLAPSGNYEFSSQNRDVTLWLPADVNARLHFSTMNGELKTEIPATINGTDTKPKVSGKAKAKNKDDDEHDVIAIYGSGTARISVDAFNGNAVVKRKTP